MGLNPDALQALNPDVIFCKLDCFSGPRPGPRSDYVGYDDLVQAATGIMLRFGGSMDTPEEHAHVGTIDVMCGFGGSLGVAAALYQKSRTGRVGRARTSLSALAGLAQIPFCYDYVRRGPFDEPAGREAVGYDALTRFYVASDGFILLSASEADAARLEKVEGLEGFSDVPKKTRAEFLAAKFRAGRAEDWIERLRAADLGAALCENIETIRARSSRLADGTPGTDRGSYSFSVYPDHPSGHEVTQLDPYAVRPARGGVRALPPAEKYGASTRPVLIELGYSEAEIAALIEDGAISESWSGEYLPS
jgi:crotonobetainyl-CoA:carnitine CoA-transferase CaiB-like acyl-CoA transferase